ncbi:MAG: GspMb/PilO family protein [Patescibacteria group bacterium]|nr:GspMb/PilO family protein [Patescibacteria group bacterium]
MTFKKKIIISIVFFLTLSILLIVFVIYPLFLEIKKISQDFLAQKQELIAFEKKAENLEKFKILFSEISPDLEKIDNLFVNPEIPVDFILFLEKISQDSGLSLKISSGLPLKTEKDSWPSLSFQLNLAGSFPNLVKFLEKLESNLYLIEIQNLTITRLSETELKSKEFEIYSLGDVKASLSIKVYTR